LFAGPFLSTVALASTALLSAGSEEQKQEWLPRIAAGEVTATVAWTEPSGRWDEAGVGAMAALDGDEWVLSGAKSYVLDGHTADLLIVAAKTEAGTSLFLVPGDATGVTRTTLDTMDMTRKQAEVRLESVRVPASALLGMDGAGWATIEAITEVGIVALALEQVGGAQRCLDMSVEYAKDRVQFGRPIGSFQSIKHKCADMLVQVEAARSAAYYAAWAISVESDERETVVPLAKAFCSDAYFHCAGENIQIHGGIGFTWEHDAHLYFKRAKTSQLLFGDPSFHRSALADRIGI
jgi:alkylation response protein AidB-like acyl-CoA dehydrogenase